MKAKKTTKDKVINLELKDKTPEVIENVEPGAVVENVVPTEVVETAEPVKRKPGRPRLNKVKEAKIGHVKKYRKLAAVATVSVPEAAPVKKEQTDVEKNDDRLIKTLIARMRRGVVKFTFVNQRGNQTTTTGTLIKSKVPTTRKVAGAEKAKNKDMLVFYDTRHGIRRQFDRRNVVAILA